MKNIKITNYLKKEYKDYAHYVIESRAIPSVIDGFKPTQRKIVYTATNHVKNVSNKVATLAGKVISDAQYHHGNVSCESAIVNMSQTFKNNFPIFDRIGQFGSLRSPFSSASRYISVKLSKNFDMVYKDNELLINKEEEGIKIEPVMYLPIIPMVLVNSGSGIAVGYATNILNRDIKDVTKKTINYLEGKRLNSLKPTIDGFNGLIKQDEESSSKWFLYGDLDIVSTSTVKITNLPPSMTYEKTEDLLEELLTGISSSNKPTKLGRLITNWENESKNGKIEYVIKFNREELAKHDKESLMKMFKLIEQSTENFTVLDETNKLKIFDCSEDILKHFADYRLSYYDKRKQFQLDKIKDDILKLNNKSLFIKGILDNKIIINKKKKEDIIKQIEKLEIGKYNDSYDYLLAMPIYSLTKEKYDELLQSIKHKKVEEKEIKKQVPKDVYIEELKDLLKKI